jgi:UDP-N-acetylglucosamine 1-carboxyvinyltransferase
MEQFRIQGTPHIRGSIRVAGAKNHVLKAIPAALLSKRPTTLANVPEILDVHAMFDIVRALGGCVKHLGGSRWRIDPRALSSCEIPVELAHKLRASVMFLPPLLARFGKAVLPHPGGCVIGRRPIDMFIDGFEAMGARVQTTSRAYIFRAPNGLKGGHVTFRRITVTGTEAILIAAAAARGKTTITFAACEPEVDALARQLNAAGSRVIGAGTHTIHIDGRSSLKGTATQIIPDRIEAGTFTILGLLTRGTLKIENCLPEHLQVFLHLLQSMGARLRTTKTTITVPTQPVLRAPKELVVHEYPGVVTDLQSSFTLLTTQAHGQTLVHDPIYEGRLFFTQWLNKMGASIIMCDPHRVVVNGPTPLHGTKMESPDIRAGITLVLAAMVAKGISLIDHTELIDRGYENLEQRLTAVGAKIQRLSV